MCKNTVEPGTSCQNTFHRPTAFLSVIAVSLGLTGLGSVIVPVPQAAAAEATASAQGNFTDELGSPETMDFTAAGSEIAAVDDQTWDSDNTGPTESPYQAFELEHPGEFAPVSWTGVVDPSREVTLLAWNYETGAWDQLRSESGPPLKTRYSRRISRKTMPTKPARHTWPSPVKMDTCLGRTSGLQTNSV